MIYYYYKVIIKDRKLPIVTFDKSVIDAAKRCESFGEVVGVSVSKFDNVGFDLASATPPQTKMVSR